MHVWQQAHGEAGALSMGELVCVELRVSITPRGWLFSAAFLDQEASHKSP